MQSQAPAGPSRETGLPPGVEVGPLGSRVVAYLIDSILPALCGVVLGVLAPGTSGGARVGVSAAAGVISLAWAVLVLLMIAGRAASPGMRVMKLQLVGFYDGRSIGLVRAFLRGLVFWALGITGIGLVIMLVLMVVHPRHQGWHDRLAHAVMIKARTLAPPPQAAPRPAAVSAPSPQQQYSDQQYPEQQYPPQGYAPQQPYAEQQPYPPQQLPQPPAYPPQYSGQPYAPSPPQPSPQQYAPPAPPLTPPNRPPAPAYGPTEADGAESDIDTAATAVHTPVTGSGWTAVLDDGRTIEIDGLVLLGRNPQPQPGEEDAQLIKIADETRTVSKSHLAIGLDAAGIYVVDRGSTNGSTVTDPGGVSRRCQVSEPIYVGEDTIVSMGDHWLRIEQASA